MEQKKYYGTIVHWFNDLHRGSILPDDSAQRIFADGQSLTVDYLSPKSGDRVGFYLDAGEKQPVAHDVSPVPDYHPDEKTVITLEEWDFQQNGGYGSSKKNKGRPVFVLGQFLTDQTRVPEIGELLEGRLCQHSNGQWLLKEAVILEQTVPAKKEPSSRVRPVAADLPKESIPLPPTAPAEETVHKAQTQATTENLPVNRIIKGSIISWDDEKGYGFINYGSKTHNIFFHISAFHYTNRRPKTGQAVSFYCHPANGCGKQKAARVVLRGDEARLSDDRPQQSPPINIINLLGGIVASAAYLGAVSLLSRKLAAVYLLVSAATFWYYREDKRIALKKNNKKDGGYLGRIPENLLHKLGLFGGWPGALIARNALNHKTSKVPFVRKFWLTAVVNIAITYALLIHYADKPFISLLRN